MRNVYCAPLCCCLLLWIAPPLSAAETHTGLVTAVTSHEITITTEAGERHMFQVADDAMITLDDLPAKLTDLKPMQRVTVVAQREGTEFLAQIVKAFSHSP